MKKLCVMAGLLAMVAGCETTRPVVKYPQLPANNAGTTSVLREADHCYIGSIDGKPIEQYDVDILWAASYRQFRVPSGKHVLSIYYHESRNFELVSGGPRHVKVDVQPDQRYVLKSNVNPADALFGDTLTTVSWRPELLNKQTGECAGEATLNAQ